MHHLQSVVEAVDYIINSMLMHNSIGIAGQCMIRSWNSSFERPVPIGLAELRRYFLS
jgi:hypothetical protein